MVCDVIVWGADGGDIRSVGELVYTASGFDLDYTMGGDNCRFSVRGDSVSQSRRGNVNTELSFRRDRETACILLTGELTGSIPVKTVSLDIVCGEEGVSADIVYYLGGAKINLKLSAVIRKENI